jgi:hypothetical protein
VIWKARKLGGITGPVVRIFSEAPAEANMHWGLQIGPYLHELNTDEGKNKHLIVTRLHDDQIWAPGTEPTVIGFCSLTDREIDTEGTVYTNVKGHDC